MFLFSQLPQVFKPFWGSHAACLSLSRGCFFMSKSIYVGNLPWAATEEQVQDLFAEYGKVLSVKLVSDRETGRARGFGFVEMEDGEAQAAIEALDNYSFGGRTLRVNEAKPRAPRPPRY
jgi:RNA recognition motif-containing protein